MFKKLLTFASAGLLAATVVQAQEYPTKLKIVRY